MRLAFWGKTIEVSLNGLVYIDLINEEKGINERYETNFPKNSVNNLIFGKAMNFTHFGDIVCKNLGTGEQCICKITGSSGLFLKERDKAKIIGHVIPGGSGPPKYRISGSWLTNIKVAKFDQAKKDWTDELTVY